MQSKSDTFLFYLGHPAHYHNISVVIQQLSAKGYSIVLVARSKDVLFELLEGLPYTIIYLKSRKGKGLFSLIATILKREVVIFRLALKYRPIMLIGTDIVIAHIGKMMNIPAVILNEDDAKEVPFLVKFGYQYASAVFAPHCCDVNPYSDKKIGYNGYQELAYLHPNYFTPDKTKVRELFNDADNYFILRFVSLTAHHDEGKRGIDLAMAKKLIEKLTPYGKVYITSERKLEPTLEKYRINISPKNIHHALYYAHIYIGDSQTMTAESAVLGTPALRFNDFVGKLSYLEELEQEHQLAYGIPTDQPDALFSLIDELLAQKELKEEHRRRREEMLKKCDDVAQLWIDYFIKNRKK